MSAHARLSGIAHLGNRAALPFVGAAHRVPQWIAIHWRGFWWFGMVFSLGVGYVAYQARSATNLDALRVSSAQRLSFYSRTFEATLEKHEYLPYVLALQRDVAAFMQEGHGDRDVDAMNRYLDLLRERARVSVIYLLDSSGVTVAASNWREAGSFVGHNYAFRPYFLDARDGRLGRFYAIGVTTQAPGYFLSYPITVDKRVVGVVAVKVSLDSLEQAWIASGDCILAADANGVVFLSAIPEWKFHTLAPLSASAKVQLRDTQQYSDVALTPLAAGVQITPSASPQRVTFPSLARSETSQDQVSNVLVQSRTAGPLASQVLLLSNMDATLEDAKAVGLASGFATGSVLLLFFLFCVRQWRREERFAARVALQRAHQQLELLIAHRTSALLTANAELECKVDELKQTEKMLRDTRDELIQAGKLAVLGQMSAGITHELNQPLTALRTLSDNTVTLMRLGRIAEASANLDDIALLSARMGKIVGQLKTFARKTKTATAPVSIKRAIDNAASLVGSRYRAAGVELRKELPTGEVRALGDEVRLEQVLVNLFNNAVDALANANAPVVTVSLAMKGPDVLISVRDNGPGMTADALDHLFEPFFTTKSPGDGLGLGLAISSAIVHGLGGELTAVNLPQGGAEFRLRLPLA